MKNNIQIEYKSTCIKTDNSELARSLTEELIDEVIDSSYNQKSWQTITIKSGSKEVHKINIAYSATIDDIVIYFDGVVIVPYELDYKLIDAFDAMQKEGAPE